MVQLYTHRQFANKHLNRILARLPRHPLARSVSGLCLNSKITDRFGLIIQTPVLCDVALRVVKQ